MPVTQSPRFSRATAETRAQLIPPGNFFGSLYVQEGPTVASAACTIQLGNQAPIQIAQGMTITNIDADDAQFGVFGTWTAGAGFVHLLAGVGAR